VLKRNCVLFSQLFSELQQSCVCLIMGTEGVPHTLELSGKCQRISLCLESGHPVSTMAPFWSTLWFSFHLSFFACHLPVFEALPHVCCSIKKQDIVSCLSVYIRMITHWRRGGFYQSWTLFMTCCWYFCGVRIAEEPVTNCNNCSHFHLCVCASHVLPKMDLSLIW